MNTQDKMAFCFPGVGVKHCGAEIGFFRENREIMEPLVERASRFLGRDLLAPFLNREISDLPDRELQFFTYGFSVGVAKVCVNRGVLPDFTSGYSFGVYAALNACGAVDFETGLEILDRAYHAMNGVLPQKPCSMGVIVGLSREDILEILKGHEFESVQLTGINSSTCQVVSGYSEPVNHFLRRALECDAVSADPLPVKIPYHHSEILTAVKEKFDRFLKDICFSAPRIPLVSTIDQKLLEDPDSLKEFITMNLCSPIDWLEVISTLSSLGVLRIMECGPGISLTQNGRFMPFEGIEYLNVKNLKRKLFS